MTDRETVAAALIAVMRDGACEWNKMPEADQEFALSLADSAFTSITYVAAKRGWHMRPDDATATMSKAGWDANTRLDTDPIETVYHAMLAVASEFEWEA